MPPKLPVLPAVVPADRFVDDFDESLECVVRFVLLCCEYPGPAIRCKVRPANLVAESQPGGCQWADNALDLDDYSHDAIQAPLNVNKAFF